MLLPIITSILRYYSRLENMSSDRILKKVYTFDGHKKFQLRIIANHICDTIGIDPNKYKFSDVKHMNRFNRETSDQLQ